MGGKPKGLLKYKNKSFIEHISEALQPFCNTILLSANSDDYSKLGYATFEDSIKEKGPLSGIHAGLFHSKTETNIFIPCDMPFIDKNILSSMLKASRYSECVAPLIQDKNCFMPLIIKRTSLHVIEEQILKKELKLGKFLDYVNCSYIRWEEAELNPRVSMNINDPNEFLKLNS